MKLIGMSSSIKATSAIILKEVYGHNALWLDDAANILLNKIGIGFNLPTPPLPLITFKYRPLNPEFLRFTWSEYPFLNKQVLINSAVQEVTRFEVMIYDLLNVSNPLVLALVKREALVKLFKEYTLQGGTFTILTLWGALTKCVLEGVSGVEDENAQVGSAFRLSFVKPNFSTSRLEQAISSVFKAFSSGGL